MRASHIPFLVMILFLSSTAAAQSVRTVRASVTYISSGSIYIDAGREKGLAEGDTVALRKGAVSHGSGVVIAVSSRSAALHLVDEGKAGGINLVALGDSVYITKTFANPIAIAPPQVAPPSASGTDAREAGAKSVVRSLDNSVSGRVALQYAQAGVPGIAPDFSQPSLYSRLNVGRLFGTGLNLSFFARTYQNAALRAYGQRTRFRLYDLSLSYDDPQSVVGGSAGRLTSTFMGGLGQIDGGQVYIRSGGFAGGVLAGFQPDYLTSGVRTQQLKGALFVHYGWEGAKLSRWDATVAYGRQLYSGKLDRDFLYIQNSARLGLDLFLYQSTEVDLHVMKEGVPAKKLQLTNTYVTLSYLPLSWLSASAGFDAARNLYLLESMKTFPDSLFDHTLKEGYRGSLSIRLPLNITVTGTGRYRPAAGLERKSQSFGGGARIADLAGTGINVGGQYAGLTGVYTSGKDLTLDADDWITRDLALMLRYDRYAYTVVGQQTRYVSTTGSAMVQWRLSNSLFWMINYDRVWDSLRDSQRLMCELGARF